MIAVLIVDDHAVLRRSLRELLAETPDIDVVAECADGSEVLETALRTRPDVVLMDVAMPGMTGLEATRLLLATRPQTRVLLLTGTVTVATVCAARELGVSGYLVKGEEPDDLLTSIRTVAAGGWVWSDAAAAHLPRCA